MLTDGKRSKTLFGLGAKRGRLHRYTAVRWSLGIALTIAVALLPITGTLRFDFWAGNNSYLGESVGWVEAAKAFAFPFLGINIAILLASRFLGRWLCGFVCPIGNLNRLAEWARWRRKKGGARFLGGSVVFLACALLAAITFSFWVDWRVFAEGSVVARSLAGAFLLGTTGVLFFTVSSLGMRFCRDYCPSGVYFAVLGPTSATGVEFVNPEECTDCHACESVCPVDLKPRELIGGEPRPGTGFYPDGLSGLANCLRCGDCIAVCEETTGEETGPTPLRLGPLSKEALARLSAENEA